MSDIKLYNGDCLEIMKDIPDNSIDLVLCDLPYGSLKTIISDGWKNNDTNISWDNILPINDLFQMYNRIVRQNGAVLLFNKEPLTTELRTNSCDDIEYAYTYIWKKNNFANPYIAKKSIVSVCENIDVYYKKYSNGNTAYDDYRFSILKQLNVSRQDIINMCGQSVDHFFRNRTKQFITEDGYSSLIQKYHIDKLDGFISYTDLSVLKNDCQRVFNLPNNSNYVSDFLEFPKDSKNFHPTQKPVKLLEYLIKIHTNENNTVLDNCMGSGSTGVACVLTNRNFIGIELDKNYFKIAEQRIENTKNGLFDLDTKLNNFNRNKSKNKLF